jgi:hypothetical protein
MSDLPLVRHGQHYHNKKAPAISASETQRVVGSGYSRVGVGSGADSVGAGEAGERRFGMVNVQVISALVRPPAYEVGHGARESAVRHGRYQLLSSTHGWAPSRPGRAFSFLF